MIMTATRIQIDTAELIREILPILTAQLRAELTEELTTQITRQIRASEERAKAPRLLRLKEVCNRVGYKATKVWQMTRLGEFPAAHKLGPTVTVWREHEVQEWIERRAA